MKQRSFYRRGMFGWRSQQQRSPMSGRLIMAMVVAAISLFSYYSRREYNPVTKEVQHISMTPAQEIAMGLQAAPEMAGQFGGESTNARGRAQVEKVGNLLLSSTEAHKTPYKFEFHLLADEKTINAFALPGGQVFITEGLMQKLETEGQLAGVLGHEMGHVVARHGAEHIAKSQLTQGLTGAAVIASYDPRDPGSRSNAMIIAMVGQLVNMKFGRSDELEADHLGVKFNAESGYDPRAMIGVMKVLEKASQGNRQPEFFSTHPNPENRIEKIESAIKELYPNGVPQGLKP